MEELFNLTKQISQYIPNEEVYNFVSDVCIDGDYTDYLCLDKEGEYFISSVTLMDDMVKNIPTSLPEYQLYHVGELYKMNELPVGIFLIKDNDFYDLCFNIGYPENYEEYEVINIIEYFTDLKYFFKFDFSNYLQFEVMARPCTHCGRFAIDSRIFDVYENEMICMVCFETTSSCTTCGKILDDENNTGFCSEECKNKLKEKEV